MTLHPTQQAAVDAAISKRISIITGGAGTGKTTIIKAIAEATPGTVHLCAFAGKAAARLREATGRGATTIHRLLMYQGDRFALDDLRGKTVIVDEASMVDSHLLAEICRRKPKRLVLVGDDAQLPPVGRAQPFHDLIALRPDLVSNLTACYRNQAAVYDASMSIRRGEVPQWQADYENERWTVENSGDAQATQDYILRIVRDKLIEFKDGTDIILAPKNGEPGMPCSVRGLNAAIVDLVNPRSEEDIKKRRRLKPGDRVINTKNNANLDIWNGTTGTINSIDLDGTVFFKPDDPVQSGDEYVTVPKDAAKHLELGYALTVHKSQGSQYRRVIFCCLQRDTYSLDRALVYTAVTRTQSQCLVAGQRSALAAAINRVRHKWTVTQEIGKTDVQH